MAIGTGLAIAAGVSAGSKLIGAKMQSNAAKNAAKTQQAGASQASNYIQQGMGQLGGLYAPYINSGAGAMGTIGRLTTPGPGATFASPGPPNAMPQPPQGGQAMPRGYPPGYPPPGYGGGGTFGQMQGPPQRYY